MLLEGFLETITKSLGANAGAIRLLSPNDNELHIAGAVGLPPNTFQCENHINRDCGVCGQALRYGGIHSDDAINCACRTRDYYFGTGCKRIVAVPLEFRGTQIGVFNLFFDTGQALANEATPILRTFAELIGISLENARLARENRRMNQIVERQAIASEIHDSLAQTLTYGRLRMSMLQDALQQQDPELMDTCMKDVDEVLENSQKSVRELITHFRCQLDPQGLLHALLDLVDEFRKRTGIDLDYHNDLAELDLPLEHETQIFNIVREVLANVSTHSDANRASLLIVQHKRNYVFTITDNGKGIDSDTPPEGHYGLTIMRERAQRIGATLEVGSPRGGGTRVVLTVPSGWRDRHHD